MRRETEHSPSALLNSVLFQGEPHASPHTGFALLSVADGACLANATPAAALKKLVTWQVGFVANPVVPPKK